MVNNLFFNTKLLHCSNNGETIFIFLIGVYPIGQIMDHGRAEGIDERSARDRFSSEEKRAIDRLHNDIYNEVRQAAEAHRQVCSQSICVNMSACN